jgi:hypothetical protein
MRTCLVLSVLSLIACHHGDDTDPYEPPEGFVTDQRIVYTDGLHNENTEMLALDDRILLIFRGGETAQIGSDAAHINVYASTDGGATFAKQSEVSAAGLPGERDIRDPKLVVMGDTIYLYAISRLPGGHYRDLLGEAWTIRAESTDHGETWTDPVKTFSDVDDGGTESFWGFWRFTKRESSDGETLYALGYGDGDVRVGMFASDDGITWEKRSIVIDSYDDVPSEAELQFYGDDQQTAVAIVRLDNQGILQDGQSAICTSQAPFTSWECGRRIEQRLDGPTWFSGDVGGARREFVVARKHLPCTMKRTAVYELQGDLADPTAPIDVCEIAELNSAGDTAYTGLVPLGGDRYLTSWYSSTIPATGDVAWLEGTFTPSDIWLADLDFSAAPADECHLPPEKVACEAPALPAGDATAATSGVYRLTVAPVIYPAQVLTFDVSVTAAGSAIDLSMQPLDASTLEPLGEPWVLTGVPIGADGGLEASFDTVSVPETAFPLLADPFLTLHELVFHGVFVSSDVFCGNLTGYAQVFGSSASDRIDLEGSTFGAVASGSDVLAACP